MLVYICKNGGGDYATFWPEVIFNLHSSSNSAKTVLTSSWLREPSILLPEVEDLIQGRKQSEYKFL